MGSIYYDKGRDRWAASIELPKERNAPRRRVKRYADNEDAARILLASLKLELLRTGTIKPLGHRKGWYRETTGGIRINVPGGFVSFETDFDELHPDFHAVFHGISMLTKALSDMLPRQVEDFTIGEEP